MKKKKASEVFDDTPKCVMCERPLLKVDIEKVVCCCGNPECPNFSLLSLPESAIKKVFRGVGKVNEY